MGWRPTKRQVLWASGRVIALLILLFIGVLFRWLWGELASALAIGLTVIIVLLWWLWDLLAYAGARFWGVLAGNTARAITFSLAISIAVMGILFWWLWGVLAGYIQPNDPTDKKDLVNVFVVIAVGVVGSITAIAAVGNLIVSRRNLQQQRDLDERHAQDDALQAYYSQIGDLLTEHKLTETEQDDEPLRLLARAQTLTLMERLGSESIRAKRKKGELLLFLYASGLLKKDNSIVNLVRADLRGADLFRADLRDVNLFGADLGGANLGGANLLGADLRDASLGGANLGWANLAGADLRDAKLFAVDLFGANLGGANLGGANLLGADLVNATLFGADLKDANLRDANLFHADLSGAAVTEGQLSSCKSLATATMPNGQSYEEWQGQRASWKGRE